MLLQIMAGEVVTNARYSFFQGWHFNNDYLYSPEGDKYTEGDIRSIRSMLEQIRSYRIQVNNLESQVAKLKSKQSEPVKKDNVIAFPSPKRLKA